MKNFKEKISNKINNVSDKTKKRLKTIGKVILGVGLAGGGAAVGYMIANQHLEGLADGIDPSELDNDDIVFDTDKEETTDESEA